MVAYSFLISMSIPHFASLVALVTSATYLTCAYTLPCCFTLMMLRDRISPWEATLCASLIPLSIVVSALGLVSSGRALLANYA